MNHRTPKLAVASLILGLLSVSLCAGIAAIVSGVVSLHHIGRSGSTLTGKGMAKAGIACALLMPLLVTYFDMSRSFAARMVCGANLTQVGKAMQAYSENHDGRLPTPAKWCDILLKSTDVKPAMLQCGPYRRLIKLHKYPLERYLYVRWRHAQYLKAGACDYPMNPQAVEKGTAGDPNTVLIFESGPGWNHVAGAEAITTEHHDGDGSSVPFLGGCARFVCTQEFNRLRWKL